MDEMTDALTLLRADNPAAPEGDLVMYATALLEWRAASANIASHGTIVAHPRTGAPIDNPYLRVRAAAMATMQKLVRVKRTNRLWTKNESIT